MGRFDNKVAIVTGAASGIGKAIAERLVAEGAQVDMSVEKEVEALLQHTLKTHGGLHVLINCAARFVFADALSVTEDDLDAALGANVKGYAFGIKHAANSMLRNPGDSRRLNAGAIVNIASTSSFVAQPGFVPYSASKGAILQLTRCAALDLGKHGIRVNAVCPGPILTDGTRQHAESQGTTIDGLVAQMTNQMIIHRMGSPEEVASAVAFVASQEASFITGTTLMVDGGYTAI